MPQKSAGKTTSQQDQKTTAETKQQKTIRKHSQEKTTTNYIGSKSNREEHRLPESKENIENLTTLKYTHTEQSTPKRTTGKTKSQKSRGDRSRDKVHSKPQNHTCTNNNSQETRT